MNRTAAFRAKRAWIPATALGLIVSSPLVAAQPAEALPSDDARFVQVDAGNASTIALTADGSVYTWGSDSEGQLGDGAPYGADTGSALPVDITDAFDLVGGHHIAKVVAGAWANYALSDDGRLWAWGMGIRGALGTGTTDNQPAPVEIDLGVPVTDVAAGLHFAAALTSTGEVRVWGANNYGQAADPGLLDVLSPTTLDAGDLDGHTVTAIGAGRNFAFAIADDGTTIYSWGENGDGQLGTEISVTSANPEPDDVSFNSGGIHKINGGESLVRAVGGGHHAAVLSDAGRVWTWGLDDHGQLGRPSVVQTNLPRLIQGDDLPEDWSSNPPVSIDLGFKHSVAVTGDGKVWVWGADTTTDLTDATYTGTDLTTPTEIPVTGLPAGDTVVAAAAGYNHTALLTAQGRILTFGLGDDGRLGRGDTTTQESPGLVRLDAISFGLHVTGYPAVGSVQTAVVTDASSPADYAYQWLRDGAAIAGGTGQTYRAVKKDLGAVLSVRVTANPENRAASERTATMSTPIGRRARITSFRITKTGKIRTLRAKVAYRNANGWRPVPKGVEVRIRVLRDGRWVPAQRAKTTKTHKRGRLRVQIKTHRKRTYRLVLPAKDHYQRAISPTRRK